MSLTFSSVGNGEQVLRIEVHMQVRVWGMTAAGEPFIQNASADIAGPQRVSIAGIEHPVPVGETLGVEYQGRRGRFCVVWTGQPDTPEAGKIEIRPLDDVQNFWELISSRRGTDASSGGLSHATLAEARFPYARQNPLGIFPRR